MAGTFRQIEKMAGAPLKNLGLQLQDPPLTRDDRRWKITYHGPEDIRNETAGQWARGMCVVDRRAISKTKSDNNTSGGEFGWLSANAQVLEQSRLRFTCTSLAEVYLQYLVIGIELRGALFHAKGYRFFDI